MQHHHRNTGFDGPGARTILGDPGPSTDAQRSSRSPPSPERLSPSQPRREGSAYSWGPEYSEQSFRHPYHPPGTNDYPLVGRPSLPRHRSQHGPPHHSPYPPSGPSRPVAPPLREAPPASASLTSPTATTPTIKRVGGKANVSSACGPCKRAHLACDVARPCKRCVNMGKEDQCEDVPVSKLCRFRTITADCTDIRAAQEAWATKGQQDTH